MLTIVWVVLLISAIVRKNEKHIYIALGIALADLIIMGMFMIARG